AFDLRAARRADESTYAGIVRLVEAAQRSKAPMARLADRYAILFLAATVGLAAAAWWFTGALAAASFEPMPIKSISFSGPSADMLMLVLAPSTQTIDFDTGLVPGVFLGSFLAALLARELELQGFKDGQSMRRYILGAAMMGFGAMLAGGCAVGAGVSGGAVFATAAWLALFFMWVGAGLTHWLVDRERSASADFALAAR
ncbi:MAG: YeeE/YedE thiosulfate transporter family protein, partial [Geminicoccaceae bacterium]|nr:YeeE/YedE thiosulfate transporter family protein [Geminicoccaceae bacterium]